MDGDGDWAFVAVYELGENWVAICGDDSCDGDIVWAERCCCAIEEWDYVRRVHRLCECFCEEYVVGSSAESSAESDDEQDCHGCSKGTGFGAWSLCT
jgi:hypothetical protein